MENNIPRRIQLEKNINAELSIRNAINEVEKIGAHINLTTAVQHLNLALNLVGDYVDEGYIQFTNNA